MPYILGWKNIVINASVNQKMEKRVNMAGWTDLEKLGIFLKTHWYTALAL